MKYFFETLLFILKRVALGLGIIYILLVLLLYFIQDSLIFFPQWASVMPSTNTIERIDYDTWGVHLSWFIRRGEWPTYFSFGGNATEALRSLSTFDFSGTIIVFNYRWYGESSGEPSEANLFQDAVILYDLLERDGYLSQKNTILFGRSLGSWVASYLSSVRPSLALILVTPFDSLVAVASEVYPFIPVKWLLKHQFLSEKYLRNYPHPILVIYGGKDITVPNTRTENLLALLPKEKKVLSLSEATHDTIHLYPEYSQGITDFSRDLVTPPR